MKKYLFTAVAMLVLAGCSYQGMRDLRDLREFVAEVKARPPTSIDPIPQIAQAETFLYIAGNRRDPFVPTGEIGDVLAQGAEEGPSPNRNRRKEVLEAFPLDALRMVGTLTQSGEVWALVRSPDGAIHRVKNGNHLGQNDGRITLIEEEKIEVIELIPNGLGGYLERQVYLTLGERDS